MRTIIKYEIEKLIKNKTVIGAIIVSVFVLAGILLVGFHYSQLQGSFQGEMERYNENVENHTGEFSDQKVREVLSDYIDRYQSSNNDSFFDFFSWNIASVFFEDDTDVYITMNTAMEEKEPITINQLEVKTINDVGFTSFSKPLKFGSYVTWYDLFKVTGQLFILTSILVILISSIVFADDTSKNTNQLLLTTRFGRNKLTIAKIITASLMSVVVFLLIQVISIIAFYIYNSGFTGWDTSIQTNFLLKLFNFPVEINQLHVFILALVLNLVGLLAIVGITLLVSSMTNSPFSALAISVGIFFLPQALTELIKKGPIYQSLNLFPINNYKIEDFLTLMSSEPEFLLNSFIQNIILTLTVLFLTKMSMDIIIYRRMKHYNLS